MVKFLYCGFIVALIASSIPLSSTLSPQAIEGEETTGFPLGVADLPTKLGFISCADGIQAIKVDDGTIAWTYSQGRIPLASTRGMLVALAGAEDRAALAIVFLHIPSGSPASSLKPLRVSSVDSRVLLSLPEPPYAKIVSQSLYIRWQRMTSYSGGANPSKFAVQEGSDEHYVEAKIDLASGDSEIESESSGSDSLGRENENSVPYIRGGEQFIGSWIINAHKQAELLRITRLGQQELVLEITDNSAASGPRRRVVLGPITPAPPYVTRDGGYVLLKTDGDGSNDQHVLVFSSLTGEKIGFVMGPIVVDGASVIGPNLYYLSRSPSPANATITAARLADGKIVWRRPVAIAQLRASQKLYK